MLDGFVNSVSLALRDTCHADNEYDGDHWGARISSVFVILVTSGIGTFLPILSSKYSFVRLPSWVFFIAKFFGSGVIVATGFIHLLQPANEALTDECLSGVWQDYPMAFAFALIALFVLFFGELISFHYLDRKIQGGSDFSEDPEEHSHSHFGNSDLYTHKKEEAAAEDDEDDEKADAPTNVVATKPAKNKFPKHFEHASEHQDPEALGTPTNIKEREQYYGQLMGVFVLEFGVMFHSVFVGISLAVAGDEFVSLYIVLVFHQMFEGLGLGTRIATTNWPANRRATPWVMALAYTLTTPIAIAIGLGVRTSYPSGSTRDLITNGVFDSVSAGILLYTGIVELMAHEFLYSNEFKGPGGFKKMLLAFFVMCWGTGLMALLGKWA
ncbi:Zinc-regulated transporter 2 [[Candida] zeylanoides]